MSSHKKSEICLINTMTWTKVKVDARLQRIYIPRFPYLKHWQAIHPSFATITKTFSNKTAETFCERLKWMEKLSEIDGQKIFKNLSFSGNPLKIFYFRIPSKLAFYLLSFVFEIGNSCFSSLRYDGNKLPFKLLKSQCQDILHYKS